MSKKRRPNPGSAAKAPEPEPPPAAPVSAGARPAPARPNRGIARVAAIFAAGFAAALLLAWAWFSPGGNRPPDVGANGGARALTAGDLVEFLRAVDNRDFAAMSRLGGELFREGNTVEDHRALLAEYAIDSLPPHQVYALFTRIGGPKSYRVLLTMEGDRVVSFMAEETAVAGSGS